MTATVGHQARWVGATAQSGSDDSAPPIMMIPGLGARVAPVHRVRPAQPDIVTRCADDDDAPVGSVADRGAASRRVRLRVEADVIATAGSGWHALARHPGAAATASLRKGGEQSGHARLALPRSRPGAARSRLRPSPRPARPARRRSGRESSRAACGSAVRRTWNTGSLTRRSSTSSIEAVRPSMGSWDHRAGPGASVATTEVVSGRSA